MHRFSDALFLCLACGKLNPIADLYDRGGSMKAEIIAVGTEILLGQIVNTNATFLAKQLADLGVDSLNQQVVGDNPERLEAALSLAESRADLVITIGGLGPTADDISKQILSAHLNQPLVVNFPAFAKLTARMQQQQKKMTPNNKVQAMLPFAALPLTNRVGLAVGAVSQMDTTTFVLLPGPPREFEPMVLDALVPYLAKRLGNRATLKSKVLRFFGIGESRLVTVLKDLIDGQSNPTLATYIKAYEVTLRITAKADNEAAAEALIKPVEAEVLSRVGEYFYGYGDDNTLAQEVVRALAKTRTHVTAAESLTAGAFQAALADVPGVSDWFQGGFVTYANHTKATMLGLDEAQIDAQGAVSEATAKAMATGALTQSQADVAISFTGVAGPGPNEGQAAGTVWIGLAQKDAPTTATLYHLPGSRHDVRYRAVKWGLFTLLRALQQKK